MFHTEPHYAGYACVLVRLAAADRGQIVGLIERAWAGAAPRRRG